VTMERVAAHTHYLPGGGGDGVARRRSPDGVFGFVSVQNGVVSAGEFSCFVYLLFCLFIYFIN
jgi:hypothetical protein